MTSDKRQHDKVDAILGSDETLAPSSGFLASVMQRVEEEAIAPPPIPFPWKRILPGFVVAAIAFVWCIVELVRHLPEAAAAFPSETWHLTAPLSAQLENTAWVALALGIAAASWLLSRRIAGRSGLF